jgi:hypothetical protein
MWAKTQGVSGPGVSVRYAQTAPSVIVWQSPRLVGTADWTPLTVTFTAPGDTVSGRVDVLWDFSAGDRAWIDDVRLECPACPAATPTPTATNTATPTATVTATATRVPGPNLLQNPSFETLSGGFPANWQQRSTAFADTTVTHGGTTSLRLEGPSSGSATTYSFQTLPLVPSQTYTLSGWVKTQSVSGAGVLLRYAQLTPVVIVWPGSQVNGTVDWTPLAITFTAPADTASGRVDVLWTFNPGDQAWVDDLRLECLTCPAVTPTPISTATATRTATPTPDLTSPPSPTATATALPTLEGTSTLTATPTPTESPTSTATAAGSATPDASATPTATMERTSTPTATATASATLTGATATRTATVTPTATQTGGTAMSTPRPRPENRLDVSFRRITQAEREGRISQEQGLIYRLHAIFRDPALPAEFAAPPDVPRALFSSPYTAAVLHDAEQLPPAARDRVLDEYDRLLSADLPDAGLPPATGPPSPTTTTTPTGTATPRIASVPGLAVASPSVMGSSGRVSLLSQRASDVPLLGMPVPLLRLLDQTQDCNND